MRPKSTQTRPVLTSMAALCLLAAGLFCLGTEAEAQDSFEPKSAETVPQESALAPKERRRIEKFLVDQFRAKGISRDLVTIIMKRVDAAAVNGRVPDPEQNYPKITSYPSVALQIEWQGELKKIASEFLYQFAVPFPRRLSGDVLIIGPPPLPDLDTLHNFTARAIEEAQGEFSRQLIERPLPADLDFGGVPSRPRKRIGKYISTIRIAPSNIALIDDAIPQALDELRKKHRNLRLDPATFPSPLASANLTIAPEHFDWRAKDHVIACVRWIACRSFDDFGRNTTPKDGAHPAVDSFAFLDSIYLTNPYGSRYVPEAVVKLDRKGSIVASFCAKEDSGYQPSRIGGPPLDRDNLRACLEAAMGY